MVKFKEVIHVQNLECKNDKFVNVILVVRVKCFKFDLNELVVFHFSKLYLISNVLFY